jgi:VCBS repeat-containing protein
MPELVDGLAAGMNENTATSLTGAIAGLGQGGMATYVYLGANEAEPQWTYSDPVYGVKVEILTANTGAYRATLDQTNANLIALGPDAARQTGMVEIPVMIKDAQGGWTHDVLHIEVTGKDNPPSILGLANGFAVLTAADAVPDAPPVVLIGAVNASDPDTPLSRLTFHLKDGAGVTDNGDGSYAYACDYGTFLLQADGSYTFTVNMDAAGRLQGGQVQTIAIPNVGVTDGTNEAYSDVTVSITGVNRPPVISVALGGVEVGGEAIALTDAAGGNRPQVSLSLAAADMNVGDVFSFQAAAGADQAAGFADAISGRYGALGFLNGKAVYTLNAGAAALP